MGLLDWLRRLIEALRKVPTPPPPPKPEPPAPDPEPEPPEPEPEPEEPGPVALANRPTQPSAMIWEGEGGTLADSYAHPGALVTVGRTNYATPTAKRLAAAGACIVLYLDPVITNPWGRYHDLLLNDRPEQGFPGEVPRWPGDWPTNHYPDRTDYLADFRVRSGSVLHAKLERVLELAISENPHLGGILLDDVGTRSWFPQLDWREWDATARRQYRDGMIEMVKTARRVCSKYGLILLVNGTWQAGNHGGGYPDIDRHGCSLADGAVIENHDPSEAEYWTVYSRSPQWASASPVTNGTPFHWIWSIDDPAGRDEWARMGIASHALAQRDRYTAEEPWVPFHPTGLPSGVTR